jgi:signal transduction histidine kinase
VIARAIRPDASGRSVEVQFASKYDTSMISMREFKWETTLALLLLWIMLMAAVAVQIRLGLHPLRRVQRELEALRYSPDARLSADHPLEVAPLVTAINALADVRATDLERARHRAADLAHSLKTPLAAIAAQSRRAREQGAIEAADALDRTIAAARSALDSELARAKGALARDRGISQTQLLPVLEAVIAVLERTEAGGLVAFAGNVPAAFHVPVPKPELTELLGALLENAVRHTHRTVTVNAVRTGFKLEVHIRDDGLGMDSANIAQSMERGKRLDETGAGHGLGLAIARELVCATGGVLTLTSPPSGGVSVTLCWADDPIQKRP